MRRIFLAVFLILPMLAACGGKENASAPPPAATPVRATSTPAPVCAAMQPQPTPGPETPSLFPAAGADDHSAGPSEAAVTMISYCDFQSPFCAQFSPALVRLRQRYPDDLRLVFRHYPLPLYDKDALAARAAEAAGNQGKFWEYHDLLFARQGDWAALAETPFREWLIVRAVELGMDQTRFTRDLEDPDIADTIAAATEFAQGLQLPSPPFLLINGTPYLLGPADENSLAQIIELILLGRRQFTDCPDMTIDPARQYLARLQTENGEIVIQLYPDKAPLAVNSFVFLARAGWFDGITFHRVLPGFMAQTGDPSGTGRGGPGYFFSNEIDPSLRYDRAGVVGMANSGPDSNGSQFFITYGPAPHLNGGYTIFGQVISGMDVLEQIAPRDPSKQPGAPPGDLLIRVTIEER